MQKLVDDLAERLGEFRAGPFLFAGAGLSRRYLGLDDWSALLVRLAALTDRSYEYYAATADGDPGLIATKIAERLHEPWWTDERFRATRDAFAGRLHTPESALKAEVCSYVMSMSADLPDSDPLAAEITALRAATVDGCITTNFDPLLELVFPEFQKYVGQEALLFDAPVGIGEIYKIHGSIEAPDSLVITKRDYDTFAAQQPYLASKLMTIFAEHPVVFIGYSLADRNVMTVLEAIVSCLRTPARLESLAKRLFFVEWSPTPTAPSLARSVLPLREHELPVTSIRVHEFHDVFTALGQRRRQLPAKLMRQLKGQVEELALDVEPRGQLHVMDLDPAVDPREVDVVFGVGIAERLRTSQATEAVDEPEAPLTPEPADESEGAATAEGSDPSDSPQLPLEWYQTTGQPPTGLLDWGEVSVKPSGLQIPFAQQPFQDGESTGYLWRPTLMSGIDALGQAQAVPARQASRSAVEQHPLVKSVNHELAVWVVELDRWSYSAEAIIDLVESVVAQARDLARAAVEEAREEERVRELAAEVESERRRAVEDSFRRFGTRPEIPSADEQPNGDVGDEEPLQSVDGETPVRRRRGWRGRGT